MKALLVSPSSVPGGAERALTGLARHLPAHGWDVEAVLLQPGPLEEWLANAGCATSVIDAGRTRQLHRTAAVVARLGQLARGADVVVSNQSKGHVYGGAAALAAGRPAVWWQHGTPDPSRIESVAARVPATAVIAGSRDAVAAQRRLTPGSRVELVQPGVDTAAIAGRAGSGDAVREQLGWQGRPVVGIVGRLQEWKGQNVFLRAAAQVAARHSEATFAVVGGAVLGWEGDYPERLRRLASELGIADRVHFAGHQDDVYPWFDACDIVVHASFGEPFGLVLVEAMALGKPLVATAAGGPTEIVEDGESGLLVPPGDHEAMATAISRLLDDEGLRQRMGAAASTQAELFDERAMTARFSAILDDVASPTPARSQLTERTVPGLHDFVFSTVIDDMKRGKVLDLGAGTGAFAQRLAGAGFDVTAVDREAEGFEADVNFRAVDLGAPGWEEQLGPGQWPLVVAIEVIEHLEAPIAFLRSVAALLAADGRAVVTTPNVDSLPARGKFLLRGKLRMLDEHGDPTHISPIFWDLLTRQYLPHAGLRLVHASTYPPDGFVVGRPAYRRVLTAARPWLSRWPRLTGDNHVLVLAGRGGDAPGEDRRHA